MALPSLDRSFIISAWLESVLYGMNCVLFGTCMYVLLSRNTKAHWLILFSCIFHMSIATAHNILCLFRGLQGLTNPAIISVPDGSILYFLRRTALSSVMGTLYIINIIALNLLLIWKLYVVWHNHWILIAMLILEAAQTATAIGSWVLILQSGPGFSLSAHQLLKTGLALNLIITIAVTSGIAYRLWRAGRNVSDLTGGHNVYKTAMYTIIESGALYTSSTIVLSGLAIANNIAGAMALNVNIQIATLVPLLLIARLFLGLRRGEATRSETFSNVGPTLARPIQVNVTEEISTFPVDTVDSSSRSTRKSTQSYHDSNVKNDGND